MKKRYAPDVPDAKWHRPGDTAYLRELLDAAGLSQRKAGPLLGMDERSMRNRISGDRPLAYPEQYCLEVLADRAQGETMNAVAESIRPPNASRAEVLLFALLDGLEAPALGIWLNGSADAMRAMGKHIVEQAKRVAAGTTWHNATERPLSSADAGKMIVGRDRFGAPIYGTLIRDHFGLVINTTDGVDVHNVPIDRVAFYTLLDPPQSFDEGSAEGVE